MRNVDGSHRLVPLQDAVRGPCSINGNWTAPPGAVGFVHTHPFTAGEVMQACGPITQQLPDGRSVPIFGSDGRTLYHRYTNQPSPADRDLLATVINNSIRRSQGMPPIVGYVIDNERITKYTGTNDFHDRTYNRCGY